MADREVVIDCAGAAMGGAARFLGELDAYLATSTRSASVIGRDRALAPGWLAQRELMTRRAADRIALNNVSFLRKGGQRTVLLRNALHFATDAELSGLGYQPPRSLRTQIPIVRGTAQRADRIVVPCTAMAERVLSFLPGVADRITVRPHPVAQRPWAESAPTSRSLLLPILNAPYKRLDEHVARLLGADDQARVLDQLLVTADASDFQGASRDDKRVVFLGRLDAATLDAHWANSRAIYFPTQLESFGYPLAEARANGRRVIALDTPQNHEIAGRALAAFTLDDTSSLASALSDALENPAKPDPQPFDPTSYFDWVLGTRHG